MFTSMFALEMLLKLLACGPLGYIRNPYNIFDGIIVVIRWVLSSPCPPQPPQMAEPPPLGKALPSGCRGAVSWGGTLAPPQRQSRVHMVKSAAAQVGVSRS